MKQILLMVLLGLSAIGAILEFVRQAADASRNGPPPGP